MTPYRTQAKRPKSSDQVRGSAGSTCPDADLAPVLVPFWLVSVARLVVGVVRHETFGLDATLASAAALLVPLMLKDTVVWCLRRLRASRSSA